MVICDADFGAGGTWNREGTIVFASSPTSPLFRVPASGGKPVPVTKLDASRREAAHRYPWFLPDGRHFLYTATALGAGTEQSQGGIRVGTLEGDDRLVVNTVSNAQFSSGRLVFVRERKVVAQGLDLARWELKGDPATVGPVDAPSEWGAFFAFSTSDSSLTLAPPPNIPSRLLWFDRAGREVAQVGASAPFGNFRLSPDGQQVATVILNTAKDTPEIWIYENAPGAGTRVVFGSGANIDPVWSPDGQRILFGSNRGKVGFIPNIWMKSLDGSAEEPFLQSEDNLEPLDWSADGRFLAIIKVPLRGKRNNELWVLDATDRTRQIAVATDAPNQVAARFSPDGKWIAYASDETGTAEIYVRPFPGPGSRWKVSTTGGTEPRWRKDGREIYYLSPDHKIMAVPVVLDATFRAAKPVTLFGIHPSSFGDVFEASADGQRFLVNSLPEDASSPPLTLLLNWTGLLPKGEPAR